MRTTSEISHGCSFLLLDINSNKNSCLLLNFLKYSGTVAVAGNTLKFLLNSRVLLSHFVDFFILRQNHSTPCNRSRGLQPWLSDNSLAQGG
jgi:hypothetical protein